MYRGEISPTKEVQYAFDFKKWVRVEMSSKHCDSSLAKDTKRCMQVYHARSYWVVKDW